MKSNRPWHHSKRRQMFVVAKVAATAIGLVAAWGQPPCAAQEKPSGDDRLQVFWRDGSTTLAADIDGWSKIKAPGEGTLDSASIDGKPLFGPRPRARLVRNMTLSAELKGPFIQLTNGDILPGSLVTLHKPSDSADQNFVSVAVTDPVLTLDARRNLIQVRRHSIARITLSGREPDSFAPGLVAFRDGGTMNARSIRWNSDGIRLLTDRSVKAAAWADLADVHLPHVDRTQAFLQDALVELPQDSDFLGRMVTTGGAVLTYHRRRIRTGLHRGNLCHIGCAPGDWDTVAYSLGEYVGQKVEVTVTVHPSGDEHAQLCGLLWGQLSLSSLIQDLPDGGQPIQPDLERPYYQAYQSSADRYPRPRRAWKSFDLASGKRIKGSRNTGGY